jgi:hypothetical protein
MVERGQIDTPKEIKTIPRRQHKYNATRRQIYNKIPDPKQIIALP